MGASFSRSVPTSPHLASDFSLSVSHTNWLVTRMVPGITGSGKCIEKDGVRTAWRCSWGGLGCSDGTEVSTSFGVRTPWGPSSVIRVKALLLLWGNMPKAASEVCRRTDEWKSERWDASHSLTIVKVSVSASVAAVVSHVKPGGLKQDTFILLKFCKPEVWNQDHPCRHSWN